MSRKMGLNIVRLIILVALVGAYGGISIAEETEEWIAENILKASNEYVSIIWIFNNDTSTVQTLFLPLIESPSLDAFKEISKTLTEAYFGETFPFDNSDYEVNLLQVAAKYGNEMLLFIQKEGEQPLFSSIPSLLVGGCDGIGIKQQPDGWIADNVLLSRTDFTTYVYFFDDDTSTVREFQFFSADADSVDTFKADAKSSIDFSFGEDWFTDYTINWVQIAAEYGDETLFLSQESGEDAVFLSIPSLLLEQCLEIDTKERAERLTDNNGTAKPWEIVYLGMIDSQVSEYERQKHLDAFIEHNAGVKDACEIMYFHSSTCGYCQMLAPWLEEFKERYPEVLITSYETHERASLVRLEAATREYGIDETFVPMIFICGSILDGVDTIESMLEPMALAVYNLPVRNG